MAELGAKLKRTHDFGITVIRANGDVNELGVVTSSDWHWYSPAKWAVWIRIKRVNAKRGHWRAFWGLPD